MVVEFGDVIPAGHPQAVALVIPLVVAFAGHWLQ
jgi:hypothetical protein